MGFPVEVSYSWMIWGLFVSYILMDWLKAECIPYRFRTFTTLGCSLYMKKITNHWPVGFDSRPVVVDG